MTRECPLREHILAPLEGLRAQGTTKVNLGDQPRGSGSDSKVIKVKKNIVTNERTDLTVAMVI